MSKDTEQISFRVDRDLADAVRTKLLQHKIATRERLTITDLLTKALKNYIDNPKEGNEMKEITLTNSFHDTEYTLHIREGQKGISKSTYNRAVNALCGIEGCTCGTCRDSRYYLYPVITDEGFWCDVIDSNTGESVF